MVSLFTVVQSQLKGLFFTILTTTHFIKENFYRYDHVLVRSHTKIRIFLFFRHMFDDYLIVEPLVALFYLHLIHMFVSLLNHFNYYNDYYEIFKKQHVFIFRSEPAVDDREACVSGHTDSLHMTLVDLIMKLLGAWILSRRRSSYTVLYNPLKVFQYYFSSFRLA